VVAERLDGAVLLSVSRIFLMSRVDGREAMAAPPFEGFSNDVFSTPALYAPFSGGGGPSRHAILADSYRGGTHFV
jgi:hypothetical protein